MFSHYQGPALPSSTHPHSQTQPHSHSMLHMKAYSPQLSSETMNCAFPYRVARVPAARIFGPGAASDRWRSLDWETRAAANWPPAAHHSVCDLILTSRPIKGDTGRQRRSQAQSSGSPCRVDAAQHMPHCHACLEQLASTANEKPPPSSAYISENDASCPISETTINLM